MSATEAGDSHLPTSIDPSDTLRGSIRTATKYIFAISPTAVATLYLFVCPWHRWPAVSRHETPQPSAFDCFLARDASASPDFSKYNYIEKDLYFHLRHTDGNISYFRFGGSVPDIQPPSKNYKSLEARMTPLPAAEHSSETNFVKLFDALHDAIVAHRAAERALDSLKSAPPTAISHKDVVIILSDGVPDPKANNWDCPKQAEEAGQPFISSEVIDSFKGLVDGRYPTIKPLEVYLVLAGENVGCAPGIKEAWQRELSKFKLRVVSYAELQNTTLGIEIFGKSKNHSCAYLEPVRPSLADDQRQLLEKGEGFHATYNFWSHLPEEAEITVESAEILDSRENRVAILSVHGQDQFPAQSTATVRSGVSLRAQVSESDEEMPDPTPATLYFDFPSSGGRTLSATEPYSIRLTVARSPYFIYQDILHADIISDVNWKEGVRWRLALVALTLAAGAFLYFVLVAYHSFRARPKHAGAERDFYDLIEAACIKPFRLIWITFALLASVAAVAGIFISWPLGIAYSAAIGALIIKLTKMTESIRIPNAANHSRICWLAVGEVGIAAATLLIKLFPTSFG